jgi:hypothetical protein
MKRRIGFVLVALSIVPLFAVVPPASAQAPQGQTMPSDQVAAVCPRGSHWHDAGLRSAAGGNYKEGHCQKDSASTPNR